MRLAEKTDVIKASPAIQIQSKITHLQRRAWNVLLANAYDELPTQEMHYVSIAELSDKLDFNSKNDDYLKETLEALVECTVRWNLLNKDRKQEWGVASLLAEATISEGICAYAYGPTLRKNLHNPRVYAKINLRLQNKFDSRYALILWEVCFDYFDESRSEGETPLIPLETFRELMGLSNNEYPQFKDLNKYVIKPAIREINKITDFHVEVEYQKKSRKVVALKFIIQRLRKITDETDTPRQHALFPDIDDLPTIAIDMIQAGISRHEALKIYNRGFNAVNADVRPNEGDWEAYLREKIDLMKVQDSDKVKNRAGWLRRAIEENWTDQKVEKRKQSREWQKRRQKIEQLTERKEALDTQQSEKSAAIVQRIIDENPDIITQVMAGLVQNDEDFRAMYHPTETVEDNYRRMPIRVPVNVEIRKRYPDRFSDILKEYEPQIQAIELEISQLEELQKTRV